jgi:CRP/FNR family transcriptional regulator, cyclic AMP receptor protein
VPPDLNLQKTPIFALFPEEAHAEVRSVWRPRRFRRDSPVFWAGDAGDSVLIVSSGQIKIWLESSDGSEAVIATMGPASIIGEMSVLDGGRRSANATAVTDTEVYVIDARQFMSLLLRYPETAVKLCKLLAGRLRDQNKLYEDAVFLDVPGRIARRLLEVAAAQDSPNVRIKVKDLAAMVGSSREHVSRALAAMEKGGIIGRETSTIVIKSIDGLATRAGLK